MVMRTWGWRIYGDFLMPSRLEVLEALWTRALELGYALHTMGSFETCVRAGGVVGKRLVLRCDVDTHPGFVERFLAIQRRLGVAGSYFFRLATLDPRIMERVEAAGGEVGYHFEELSTWAKDHRLGDSQVLVRDLPAIRERFLENLDRIRRLTGLALPAAAAHGDFVNRRLKVSNTLVLEDAATRARGGIRWEAYDDVFTRSVAARFCDRPYPEVWGPGSPLRALGEDAQVILLLYHPRQWQAAPWVNLKDDLNRLWEGLRFPRTT